MYAPRLLAAGVLLAVSACAPVLSRVRMQGEYDDLSAITGKWNGEYRNPDLGRNGSIVFRFAAPEDVAFGDVAMGAGPMNRGAMLALSETMIREPVSAQVLKIRFVSVVKGQVFGVLEPYADESCGCVVRTTFTGHLDDPSTIRGTFTTTSPLSSTTRTGTWKVRKQR